MIHTTNPPVKPLAAIAAAVLVLDGLATLAGLVPVGTGLGVGLLGLGIHVAGSAS